MSLSSHDGRFDDERGGDRVDPMVRDDAAAAVQLVAEIRERILLEARAGAEQIRQRFPKLIDCWEVWSKSETASPEEQIQGYVECVSDCFGDLIDSDELRRLEHIADTGRDE